MPAKAIEKANLPGSPDGVGLKVSLFFSGIGPLSLGFGSNKTRSLLIGPLQPTESGLNSLHGDCDLILLAY
jgi:hypothetical protein